MNIIHHYLQISLSLAKYRHSELLRKLFVFYDISKNEVKLLMVIFLFLPPPGGNVLSGFITLFITHACVCLQSEDC